MSARLSAFRAGAAIAIALAWASACGSAGQVTTSGHDCLIYYENPLDKSASPDASDGGALCPAGTCNYQTQEGCPPDQNCFPHYDAATNSVKPTCGVAGPQKAGDPCDGANQICARGLVCADHVCEKTCCGGDYTACGSGESCIRQAVAFQKANGDIISYDEGLGTCAPVGNCDVFDSSGTCTTDPKRPVCRIVDPTGAVACSPAGDRGIGDPCDADHQCGAGQHCVGNIDEEGGATNTHCVHLCRFGSCNGKPACAEGEGVCVHFFRDPDGVGECTLAWKGPGVPVAEETDAATPPGESDASTADR